jgi:hypothetical protein
MKGSKGAHLRLLAVLLGPVCAVTVKGAIRGCCCDRGVYELYKLAWHEVFACGWLAHPASIRARARRAQSGQVGASDGAPAYVVTGLPVGRRCVQRMESGSAAVFMDEAA